MKLFNFSIDISNEKFLDKVKKTLPYLLITAIFILFLSIGIYFFTFHGKLSTDSNDWQSFGGYLEGTLGVLIAFINLCITIFIALIANDFAKQNSHETTQINLRNSAFQEFLITTNNDFRRILELQSVDDWRELIERLKSIRVSLEHFNIKHSHLFFLKQYPGILNNEIYVPTTDSDFIYKALTKMEEEINKISSNQHISTHEFENYKNTSISNYKLFIEELKEQLKPKILINKEQ